MKKHSFRFCRTTSPATAPYGRRLGTFPGLCGQPVSRFSRGDSAAVDAALPLAVSYEHAAIISVSTVSKNEAVTDSDGVVAPALLTPTELAQASGLREDLIARFIPAASTPTGPLYAAQQMALAVYVKELTDHNLPPAAVEDKVREFLTRPATPIPPPIIPKPAARRRLWAAIGGTATAALLLGGVIGSISVPATRTASPPLHQR
jgi:hypothetical protein